MKNIKNNYKQQFEKNFNAEDRLDLIKENLEFKPVNNNGYNKKNNKFKWLISSLSLALASVIIVVLSFTLLKRPVTDENIPVYTGMNVLDSSPVREKSLNSYRNLDFDGIEIDYYADKNEKIRVAIHLRNPLEYEILSLRINGKKFQTFEFKEGSTSELIYIDLSCQDEAGIEEFYIHEIKYIDGTTITEKEVKYESSQSIYVALAYTKPSVLFRKEEINLNNYSLDFSLTDIDDLTENKTLTAKLYEENKEVDLKLIDRNEQNISFTNLKMNKEYKIILYVNADLLDGNDEVDILLLEREFKTKSGFINDKFDITRDKIKLDLEVLDSTIKIENSKLYLDDKLVASNLDSNLEYNDLYSNASYSLEINYSYLLNNERIYDSLIYSDIKTKSYKPLTQNDINGVLFKSKNKINVSVDEIIGDFCKAKIEDIELYVNGNVVYTTTNLLFSYDITEEITDVYIKINASYSLNEASNKIYYISKIVK